MNMLTALTTTSLPVLHFDGQTPQGEAATLIWSERTAKLIGRRTDAQFALPQLRVSPRVGSADRFIALPDGGQLQCADHALLDRLPQESRTEDVVAWLERQWGVALACVALLAAGLVAGYFYGLPAAAEYIAPRVPMAYEQHVGEQGLTMLDNQDWFQPTKLPTEKRQRILEDFYRLSADLPSASRLRLEFRLANPAIGANAFALPGGTIVLTDQMARLANSPEELSAILAHEIGHVELRHTLRHVLQGSVAALVAATLTGDASGVGLVVSGLPLLLVQASYSRDFEREADDFAFALLKRRGYSPHFFAKVMERLEHRHDKGKQAHKQQGDNEAGDGSDIFSFLSSHPVTKERIARARAAGGIALPAAPAHANELGQSPENEAAEDGDEDDAEEQSSTTQECTPEPDATEIAPVGSPGAKFC